MLEENDESQKLQARMLDGSTAPHCEHVFVTGAFCAADAPTPVRSEPDENNNEGKRSQGKVRRNVSYQIVGEFVYEDVETRLQFVVRACRG
jgi:hypothetical protein